MNRRAAAALLATLMLAGLGCPKTDSQDAPEYRASVAVRPVARGRVERTLTTTGTVRAREHGKIVAEASGALRFERNPATGRRFAIGDQVREGQVIAAVATQDLRTSSRLESRRQALAVTRSEHARQKKLSEEGLVSDTMMAEMDSKLAAAEAEYDNALLTQSKSRVEAPITGVLTNVTNAADGELVAERTLLAEVMRFDEVLVDLDLGAGDVLGVDKGMSVRLLPPTSSSVSTEVAPGITGTIERVAPAIDPVSRTFRVEVGVDNREHRLRPGMFVRADIVLDAREDVLVVPTASVVERNGSWCVFVVEGPIAVQRPVEIGLASEETTEIMKGVSEGNLVITSGQDTIQDAARVTVNP